MQIDGEPWIQSQPCVVEVSRRGAATVLVPVVESDADSGDGGGGDGAGRDRDLEAGGPKVAFRAAGEVLQWGEHAGVISHEQRELLQAELDRRRQQAVDYGPHAGTAGTV